MREQILDNVYAREITGRAPALRGRPPHKKVREGIRDTNFSPLSRSLDFPGSLLAAEAAALPVNAAKAILAYYFALCLIGHAAAEAAALPVNAALSDSPCPRSRRI